MDMQEVIQAAHILQTALVDIESSNWKEARQIDGVIESLKNALDVVQYLAEGALELEQRVELLENELEAIVANMSSQETRP